MDAIGSARGSWMGGIGRGGRGHRPQGPGTIMPCAWATTKAPVQIEINRKSRVILVSISIESLHNEQS
jgi:hypothetical protein